MAWPSAAWQRISPKHSTYGYDVIAQIGWERQKGRERFEAIQAHLLSAAQAGPAGLIGHAGRKSDPFPAGLVGNIII